MNIYPIARRQVRADAPIGHGPLADAARAPLRLVDTDADHVEPIHVSRWLHEVERELPACWADACGQDSQRCPCPDACRLTSADRATDRATDRDDGFGLVTGLLWSLAITALAIAAAGALMLLMPA